MEVNASKTRLYALEGTVACLYASLESEKGSLGLVLGRKMSPPPGEGRGATMHLKGSPFNLMSQPHQKVREWQTNKRKKD